MSEKTSKQFSKQGFHALTVVQVEIVVVNTVLVDVLVVDVVKSGSRVVRTAESQISFRTV